MDVFPAAAAAGTHNLAQKTGCWTELRSKARTAKTHVPVITDKDDAARADLGRCERPPCYKKLET